MSVAYYQAVAPWFCRTRRPSGDAEAVAERGRNRRSPQRPFFHKNLEPKSTPDWVRAFTIAHSEGDNTYPLIDDAATLAWLAQQAALEVHVPQWRCATAAATRTGWCSTWIPGRVPVSSCASKSRTCAARCWTAVGFASVPVTSGSKGIHLYAAMDGR